jgi:type II restriction enzyme
MNLTFYAALAGSYKSGPQKIKNLSEHWLGQQIYCPNCGQTYIEQYGNNRPVADFFCSFCHEDYELKSQSRMFGIKVVDGAYRTMMERLSSDRNPNLFLLHYDPRELSVRNLLVIPKHFFVPQIIEERKPLSPWARRAGWIGCNISLRGIPHAGRIFLIRDGNVERQREVLAQWQKTLFLRDQKSVLAKGWLLSIMKCVENLEKTTFTIEEVYRFEDDLRQAFPSNRHVKEKIRQQLQVLRDKGYLEFLNRGTYRLAGARSE